jgi:hypothetical protein
MNNVSKSRKQYNSTLDSIGTEISYSATSDMPGVSAQNVQAGGGFLDSLFNRSGANPGTDPVTDPTSTGNNDTNMTALIMNALETGQTQVADFLLEKRFVPDMTIVDKNGNTFMHLLVDAADRSKNAGKALIQLIKNKNYQDVLNKPNNKGNTPLHVAATKGFNDLVEFMTANGAIRSFNKEDLGVFTDYYVPESVKRAMYQHKDMIPSTDDMRSAYSNIRDKAADSVAAQQVNLASIFSKNPTIPGYPVTRDEIADIVKAFKTSNDQDSTVRDFTRTEFPGSMFPDNITLPGQSRRINAPDSTLARAPDAVFVKPSSTGTKVPMDNPESMTSSAFIEQLAKQLAGNESMTGGAKNKRKTITTKNKIEKTSVTGNRIMRSFSEENWNDMLGGLSEDEMRNISRAASNQKDKFREEALEKILSHLPTKDVTLATAIRAVLYAEIKEKKKELSGLDRAAELMKIVTKKKVDEVLEQKDLLNQIISHLEQKNKERANRGTSGSTVDGKKSKTNTSSKPKKSNDNTSDKPQKSKKSRKAKANESDDFESSVNVDESSDYSSPSDDSEYQVSKHNTSKRKRYVDF